jgi:hypothetical protein
MTRPVSVQLNSRTQLLTLLQQLLPRQEPTCILATNHPALYSASLHYGPDVLCALQLALPAAISQHRLHTVLLRCCLVWQQIEYGEGFKVVGNHTNAMHWAKQSNTQYQPTATSACIVSFVTIAAHVLLQCLQIEYGERFKVVGNQPALGSWDVNKAPELKWYDGDLWAGSVELPVGKDIEFKVNFCCVALSVCLRELK